jgi:hypothetical protein
MTSDQEREELHHEKLFENNIMPKLIREYMDTGVKVPFDLKRIRGFTEEEGLSTRAWDDRDLQSVVDTLVRNRLVDDLCEGRYRISDTGLEWKEST